MNFTIQLLKLAHVFWTSVLEKPATKNCYFLNLRSQLLTNFEYERILMNRKYIYAKPWSTMLQWHERMVITHMRALIWTLNLQKRIHARTKMKNLSKVPSFEQISMYRKKDELREKKQSMPQENSMRNLANVFIFFEIVFSLPILEEKPQKFAYSPWQ